MPSLYELHYSRLCSLVAEKLGSVAAGPKRKQGDMSVTAALPQKGKASNDCKREKGGVKDEE
jgi:hypothetical protein